MLQLSYIFSKCMLYNSITKVNVKHILNYLKTLLVYLSNFFCSCLFLSKSFGSGSTIFPLRSKVVNIRKA